MKRVICFTGILLVVYSFFLAINVNGQTEKNRTQKISTNDHYKYIAINEVLMWVSNNGDGSHDPRTDGNGYYWPTVNGNNDPPIPPNYRKSAIFEDGLVYGGKVNGQIRVNGNTHRKGLQAGRILSPGVADDPTLLKYRVYRIRKDWQSFPPGPVRTELERDYNEWPVEDGAPWEDVNGDGVFTRSVDKPKFDGDEVLWYVANDLDTARTAFTYGSPPLGLEFQTTIYGYFADSINLLGNVVFKKYKVINKSDTAITDMYFSYWTDDDLGDAADDYIGCDTILRLGFTYNGDNDDGGGTGNSYGSAPPAVGHLFLQSPVEPGSLNDSAYYNGRWHTGIKNVQLSSFILFIGGSALYRDPSQGVYSGSLELYNYLQGKVWDGTDYKDPNTNITTRFCLSGDPVNGSGWYEGAGWPNGQSAGDRRYLLSAGPFNMSPGDTQEVVIAILISKGTNNINSLAELKRDAQILVNTYTDNFKFKVEITSPELKTYSEENKIVLWWQDDIESFDEIDKSLMYGSFSDSTYTFEGYKIWQFEDTSGTNPQLFAIYDKENDVQQVKDYVIINGLREYITVLNSPNLGLQRYINITRDSISHTPLLDGTPYYFGLSTYAHSTNSFPKIIESLPKIIEVIPGKKPIDVTYTYSGGDTIFLNQTHGASDVSAKLFVEVPSLLKGDTYEVQMKVAEDSYSYFFINKTSNDTLLKSNTINNEPDVSNTLFDGMKLIVDIDDDIFIPSHTVKKVIEYKGPGGSFLNPPPDVFESQNSTNQWQIKSIYYSANNYVVGDIHSLNYRSLLNDKDYEIRFTGSGSEYYTTGYRPAFPTFESNPKGKGRVPFEVWELSRDNSEPPKRLFIKTEDGKLSIRDTSWSKDDVNNYWESVYTYVGTQDYSEPLPQLSGVISSQQHRFGNFSIVGNLPEEGTVIRINTKKPPRAGDVFTAVATAPTRNNFENAKQNIEKITIFPNPYFGSSSLEAGGTERLVRLTNLPQNVIVRIYSLAGVFIKRIDKDTPSPWLDWDLRNEEGSLVGSGIYLVYLDMPGIGTKILKLAVVQSN
ncbi:MAG: hypothetical protein IPM56_02710 [Ignavibacteriales bacterium]|nr:MAG: hypothetical protein IPM56_02710 [Ignavibacteriales bacterium]